MMESAWTDESLAVLRTMWSQGHSARDIAHAVGRTRDAVIGRAHRLGLAARPSPVVRREKIVGIIDLAPSACQFPINDGRPHKFCGEPVTKRPYCNFHRSVAYRPLVPPEKRQKHPDRSAKL